MSAETTTIARATSLLVAYARGERTNREILEEILGDDTFATCRGELLGVNSAAQELLEALGGSPFDLDQGIDLGVTRAALSANLDRVRAGTLEPGDICFWLSDWFGWHVPSDASDDVVLEIASELMIGEERVEELVAAPDGHALLAWHLANTPAGLGDQVGLGLAVFDRREPLVRALVEYRAGELDADGLKAAFRPAVRDRREAFPTFLEDIAEVACRLGQTEGAARFIDALARCADPLTAESTAEHTGDAGVGG